MRLSNFVWREDSTDKESISRRFLRDVLRTYLFQIRWIWYICTNSSKNIFLDPNPNPLDLVCTYEFLQKYLLDPKEFLLDDALVYLRRNLVCNKVLNLIQNLTESSLKEKIRDQSVSTYVLDSLSVRAPLGVRAYPWILSKYFRPSVCPSAPLHISVGCVYFV